MELKKCMRCDKRFETVPACCKQTEHGTVSHENAAGASNNCCGSVCHTFTGLCTVNSSSSVMLSMHQFYILRHLREDIWYKRSELQCKDLKFFHNRHFPMLLDLHLCDLGLYPLCSMVNIPTFHRIEEWVGGWLSILLLQLQAFLMTQ